MAEQLNRVLQQLVQRTGSSFNQLQTATERAAFTNNVKADLTSMLEQINTVYYPLVKTLLSEQDVNALDYGLSGNVIKTHVQADSHSAGVYWNSTGSRPRTIKETTDALLAEIARLENLINQLNYITVYDDTSLTTTALGLRLNLSQLVQDAMGSDYRLDGDGVANLTYSLSQALDAIGAFFTGFPTTGNTYDSEYPELSLNIPDVASLKLFVGMSGTELPVYTAHGAVDIVADGDSLEEAVQKLDLAVSTLTLQSIYDAGDTGDINVNSSIGAIHVNGVPDMDDILKVSLDGIEQFSVKPSKVSVTGVPLVLPFLEAMPGSVTGTGQSFTYTEVITGETISEQAYVDDLGNPTIITRSGRVREYQMGSYYIFAKEFVPAATPPTLQTVTMGTSPGSDMLYEVLSFPGTGNATTAYVHVSPPIDDQDEHPKAARIELFATPTSNPGAVSDVTFAFKIDYHDLLGSATTTDTSIMIDGDSLTPTWDSTPYLPFTTFDVPADLNKLFILTHTLEFEEIGSSPCLVPIRIQRDPAAVNDTYTGDVGIIGMRITWYRHAV